MNEKQLKFEIEIESAISNNLGIRSIRSAKKDKIEAYCKKAYGMTYKDCCIHRRLTHMIDDYVLNKVDTETLIEKYFSCDTDSSQFYRLFIRKAAPITTIKEYFLEGGDSMASKENQLEVFKFLSGRTSRVTCSEISKGTGLKEKTVKDCIADLREGKIVIVSRPGGHKSGFLMNDNEENKKNSEIWINNVRVGRFNLDPNFKYA